jgi:hypothetical protein
LAQCFNPTADIRQTLMSFGFQHEDGWFDMLRRLCGDLDALVLGFERETGRKFEILQVNEKLGGLRFHVNHETDAIRQCLLAAEQVFLRTREVCGLPGRVREGDWIKTSCDEHPGIVDEEPKEQNETKVSSHAEGVPCGNCRAQITCPPSLRICAERIFILSS